MEILNDEALTLMEHRQEYMLHGSAESDEEHKRIITDILERSELGKKLTEVVFSEEIGDSELRPYLKQYRRFRKTRSQLNSDYDRVREKVDEILKKYDLTYNISTRNMIAFQKIAIVRRYDVPEDALLSLFGISHNELQPLMKKKGFMEKFCRLRLNQIFKEICTGLKTGNHIDIGFSVVYYNKITGGFSLDFKYIVDVDFVNDEKNMKTIAEKIKNMEKHIDKQYKNKLNFEYFSDTQQKHAKKEAKEKEPELSDNRNDDFEQEIALNPEENDKAEKQIPEITENEYFPENKETEVSEEDEEIEETPDTEEEIEESEDEPSTNEENGPDLTEEESSDLTEEETPTEKSSDMKAETKITVQLNDEEQDLL